jgi:DNA modification methylase
VKASAPRRERFECTRCGRQTNAPRETKRLEARLCSPCFGKGKDRRRRELNDLTGREWAQASRSVEEYPDVRSEKQRLHGASFPQALAEQQIAIYTKEGQTVLDPFVGVGTSLDACAALGRKGIGIDLSEDFLDLARADLEGHPSAAEHKLIQGDARELRTWIPEESVDFLLTSPPYGSLLKNVKGAFAYKWQEHSPLDSIENPRPYSEQDEDLGNMDYGPFLEAIGIVLHESFRALKSRAYAVWVVKDFRAPKEGVPYVNLHSDVIAQAQQAGFDMWDLRIYNQTRYRPLVCLGYPSRNFYLNIGHSYILVFRKP